ncbi:YceI family protein [Thiocapsa marina]|uniref:Uncharacterized protein n=1 Tax=Thiocapsa marina 5811 TaxID=768671 RepID=F9U621_9GAMM|nr:hypothetical protein [Thiocapsa marina]EGV20594.1 hypothetical protein ThimaDRAFT_0372 [Thiocapsa marina 5811]
MKAINIKMLPIAIWCLAVAATIPSVATAAVERYVIDTEGGHAFVQFRVKHLAYSWLYGRFND